MNIFGIYFSVGTIIGCAIAILAIAALIIVSIKSEKKVKVADLDKREKYGDFHGLLTQADFDTKSDDPMLEIYRMQWIKAEPDDEKDNYLLLYLALKQLNKEQDESEEEWTQEQCEARMDQIIAELSEKTGLKPIVNELDDTEYDIYFNEAPAEEDTDSSQEESEPGNENEP